MFCSEHPSRDRKPVEFDDVGVEVRLAVAVQVRGSVRFNWWGLEVFPNPDFSLVR